MSEQKQSEATNSSSAKDNKNVWTTALNTAVETVAKDNKLLSTVLKIVLSPLGLIAVLCGIGYLWYKNNEKKNKIVLLEKELANAQYEIKDLEKEVSAFEKNRKPRQIETIEEEEEMLHGIGYLPARRLPKTFKKLQRKHIHLD